MSEIIVEKTSICRVREGLQDSPDIHLLDRFYDIEDNEIKEPQIADNEPKSFENRVRIYKNDGPDKTGTIGVWYWSARPNLKDPKKDYVESVYQSDVHLIKAKIFKKIKSIKALVEKFKSGISYSPKTFMPGDDLMVVFKNENGDYDGVYCPNDCLVFYQNSVVSFNESMITLKIVHIQESDLLDFGDIKVYKYFSIEAYEETLIKPIMNIVKQCADRRQRLSLINEIGAFF